MKAPEPDDAVATKHRNEVVLQGRLAAAAEHRELPSGDQLLSFRIIVDRERDRTDVPRRVDTIDCVAWSARTQRSVRGWAAGDLVSVEGAVRRRFRRSDQGPLSRVEVEVRRARRLHHASS
ncbi:MAG: single-stranded DNA-binding protein [Actinomycetota bacterium]|jgi:single-strand DNA-binding protein|nr:single-stranded DNA-binding protein [Actinomycetota bacterium]